MWRSWGMPTPARRTVSNRYKRRATPRARNAEPAEPAETKGERGERGVTRKRSAPRNDRRDNASDKRG